jgi:hypothetical protein
LCAFIGQDVTAVEESAERGLVIDFASGTVTINPKPGDIDGPELAMLTVHDPVQQTDSWAVWRPGEDIFAGRK